MPRSRVLVAPRLTLTMLAGALAACSPSSTPARAVYPLGDEPMPAPSERCFRDRSADGASEQHLRLVTEPEEGRITVHQAERGPGRRASWTTVMTVAEGAHFTSLEEAEGGEARGEGTLAGWPYSWSGWTAVERRSDGAAEHVLATLGDDDLEVATEVRAADGAVVANEHHRYREVACSMLGDQPMESLEPLRPIETLDR